MAFIIKFVYFFPLNFAGKLIITDVCKSSHLVALFFHVLEPRTLLGLFFSITWVFFFFRKYFGRCVIFTGTNLCFVLHKLDMANAISLGTLFRFFIVCFLSFHEMNGYKFGHSALTKRRLLFPTGERQIADQMIISGRGEELQ